MPRGRVAGGDEGSRRGERNRLWSRRKLALYHEIPHVHCLRNLFIRGISPFLSTVWPGNCWTDYWFLVTSLQILSSSARYSAVSGNTDGVCTERESVTNPSLKPRWRAMLWPARRWPAAQPIGRIGGQSYSSSLPESPPEPIVSTCNWLTNVSWLNFSILEWNVK